MSEKENKWDGGHPGDVVKLAHPDTGFTDPDTGFDISRDQELELGKEVGKATQQAILSGGLLLVKDSEDKGKPAKGSK